MAAKGGLTGLFIIFAIILSNQVSANFACGEIDFNDADIYPSWMIAEVSYTSAPNFKTYCEVSPADYKFCCDTDKIKNVSWAVGKQLKARVFTGEYFADEVYLNISGEGFDVFPKLFLKKIIKVFQPNDIFYFNATRVYVNFSTHSKFSNLSYSLINYDSSDYIEKNICDNCTHAEFYLENLSKGGHLLYLKAKNYLGEEANVSIKFYILDYFVFGREIVCEGCNGIYVPSGSNVTMNFFYNSSHRIEGNLIDYYPLSWATYSPDVEPHSISHGKISWPVEGTFAKRNYTLVAPQVNLARKYFFREAFDSFLGDFDEVVLYRFYTFFPISQNFNSKKSLYDMKIYYSFASESKPLFFKLNGEMLEEIAIFPNKENEKVSAFVSHSEKFYNSPGKLTFRVGTNLKNEDVKRVMVRFKQESEKSFPRVFFNDGKKWTEVEVKKYKESGNYSFYEANVYSKGIFSIMEGKYE